MITVHQIPAAHDNLIWLIQPTGSNRVFAVDGPFAQPVLEYCDERELDLVGILNTHIHWDHIGINKQLLKAGWKGDIFGNGDQKEHIPGLTHPLKPPTSFELDCGVMADVLLTEGHLDGHISYLIDGVLFCGDTLFGAGCGYLFDGPPEKMFRSLQSFAGLPDDTQVCPAHEYTWDNLRFAFTQEPNNSALKQRIVDAREVRRDQRSTLPTNIGLEKATNPFVRASSPELFAQLRALKDTKQYLDETDENLQCWPE